MDVDVVDVVDVVVVVDVDVDDVVYVVNVDVVVGVVVEVDVVVGTGTVQLSEIVMVATGDPIEFNPMHVYCVELVRIYAARQPVVDEHRLRHPHRNEDREISDFDSMT